jgi:hypothetical protein
MAGSPSPTPAGLKFGVRTVETHRARDDRKLESPASIAQCVAPWNRDAPDP